MMDVLFVLFLLGMIAFGNDFQIKFNTEKSLRRWAASQGFEVVEIEVIKYPATGRANPHDGLAKAVLIPAGEETKISRELSWNVGFIGIVYIKFITPPPAQPEALGVELDLDQNHLSKLSHEGKRPALEPSHDKDEVLW